jgi:pimeloyl-ACP methyl ester carboxylesterase
MEPDVEAIRTSTLAEMRQGHDVVVVCHSYGGIPTGEALKGLDKPHTSGGGRVSAIVYIAAFIIPEGVTLLAANKAHGGYSSPLDELPDDENFSWPKNVETAGAFYNDVTIEEAAYWLSNLSSHALVTMNTSADYAAWKDIPAWYLICKRDKALNPDTQRALVKEAREYLDQVGGAGTGGKNIKSEEIDTSHSPFLSRPEETAAFIEEAATTCGN